MSDIFSSRSNDVHAEICRPYGACDVMPRAFYNHAAPSELSYPLGLSARAHAAGANERVIMAVIGPGGMGNNLLSSFAAQKDVDVVLENILTRL